VPNVPSDDTPTGDSDADNVEIRRWGEPPKFDFEPKDHVELGELLDIIDIPRGTKIAGSRTYYLKNEGALLELAICRFTLDHLVKKGFTPFLVPLLVRDLAMVGTGFFPGGEEQAYRIERDSLNLIGTSEVSLASYHADEVLELGSLPRLYAGFSACFRREAGTYGKDTHGIYRVHQFHKVEQVVICENDADVSRRLHNFILGSSEEVLQALGLPHRVVAVCTAEMGQGQVYKNDVETWMPSRKGYGETHSCSTLHEFQARRLNIRYRDRQGKMRFAHTLNDTAIASPRVLIPILECNQQSDGSVVIPSALRPYMAGQERITPRVKVG
jgi:seryl-tRNA synthetase